MTPFAGTKYTARDTPWRCWGTSTSGAVSVNKSGAAGIKSDSIYVLAGDQGVAGTPSNQDRTSTAKLGNGLNRSLFASIGQYATNARVAATVTLVGRMRQRAGDF